MNEVELQRNYIEQLEKDFGLINARFTCGEPVDQKYLENLALCLQEARAKLSILLRLESLEANTGVLPVAQHLIVSVAARDAANLEALTLLIEGLRPLVGALSTAKGIRTGEEYGEERREPGLELFSCVWKTSDANLRAEVDGYVLGLSPDGELLGGEASGWWCDREGYTWSTELVPVTINEAARHVWADEAASHVEREVRDRAERALARSERLTVLADELRMALRGVRGLPTEE